MALFEFVICEVFRVPCCINSIVHVICTIIDWMFVEAIEARSIDDVEGCFVCIFYCKGAVCVVVLPFFMG